MMTADTPEFSRPFRIDQISAAGNEYKLSAEPAEREALARRFGILSIDSLSARVRLKAIAGGTMVRVKGWLTADVTQACVVTLEPVPEHIEEEFELTFAEPPAEGEGDELELSMEDDDPPDHIENGAVDAGEAVAEHLALALNPFPRSPNAAVPAVVEVAETVDERPNPFAVLGRLRQKKE